MSNPQQWNINGEAAIYTNTGSANALEKLGVSVDGVSITEQTLQKDIFMDTTGPLMPADTLYLGMIIYIDMDLIWYDPAVLQRIKARNSYYNSTLGQLNAIGTTYLAAGIQTRLLIQSPSLSDPKNYPNAVLIEDLPYKVNASEPITPHLRWKALWTPQATTTQGSVIYNTATS